MPDLLTFVEQDTRLRRVAATRGGEYAGPCPYCGGRDRFRVWPQQGRYWCRQCGKKGDAIQYLREVRGLSFLEAKRALGLESVPFDRGKLARHRAQQAAQKAERIAYEEWSRQKMIALTDEYRALLTARTAAVQDYARLCEQPACYTPEEATVCERRLGQVYDRLAVLENDLDILTYEKYEPERRAWWVETVTG